MKFIFLLLLGLSCFFTGCVGTHMFSINSPDEAVLKDACEGVYELKGLTSEFAQIGKIILEKKLTSSQNPQEHSIIVANFRGNRDEVLPIYIEIKRSKVSDNSSSAQINNFFSFLTLGLWPWIESRTQCYQIGISGEPDLKKQEFTVECSYKAWSSNILFPIAALPVPGKATWRSGVDFGGESVYVGSFGGNTQTKIQHLYPISEVDKHIGMVLLQRLSEASNNIYFRNKRNRLYTERKKQEEEKARIEEKETQKRRLHLALIQKSSLKLRDISKESRKDQMLQDFTVKEEPKIWEVIERSRAALSEQDIKILNLKTDLETLGKNTIDDLGYIALCEERYQYFQLYSSLYEKLGKSYLMMKSGETNSWEKGRQLLHECVNDALHLQYILMQKYQSNR